MNEIKYCKIHTCTKLLLKFTKNGNQWVCLDCMEESTKIAREKQKSYNSGGVTFNEIRKLLKRTEGGDKYYMTYYPDGSCGLVLFETNEVHKSFDNIEQLKTYLEIEVGK